MEKKTVKRLVIIILVLVFLVLTLFFADMYKVLNMEDPLFSIKKNTYGERIEYMGFGYKILVKRDEKMDIKELKYGTIFTKFNIGDGIDD